MGNRPARFLVRFFRNPETRFLNRSFDRSCPLKLEICQNLNFCCLLFTPYYGPPLPGTPKFCQNFEQMVLPVSILVNFGLFLDPILVFLVHYFLKKINGTQTGTVRFRICVRTPELS